APVVGGAARFAHFAERPHVLLVQSISVAQDLHPPSLQTVARETQLRVGNSHLRSPAERIDTRRCLPDWIPRRIAIELIAAHAGRIHLEPGLVDLGVIRIEYDYQLIGSE